MSKILEYEGYSATIKHDTEDGFYHGKIEGITDLVTFEASTVSGAEKEFKMAVHSYLKFCRDVGKDPESCKGGFNT